MSTFFVAFEIANYADEIVRSDNVRIGTAIGLVDPSMMRLHISRAAVVKLGLRVERRVFMRRTWCGKQYLDKAWDVRITVGGRSGIFSAVVEPDPIDAILGQMVMTELDLVADTENKRLVPRDPNTTITEIE